MLVGFGDFSVEKWLVQVFTSDLLIASIMILAALLVKLLVDLLFV